jgi:hypothetical protein
MSASVEEMPMNQRTPADPPPVVGKKGIGSAFAPGLYVRTGESPGELDHEHSSAEPKRSFFRGVAVGLAIMIPVWAWLIIRLLH